MKSYCKLKAEIKVIQQQIAEVKKNKRDAALKEVKHSYKKFYFTAWIQKGSLANGLKKQ